MHERQRLEKDNVLRMRQAKERVAVKELVRDEKDSRKEEQAGTR